LKAGAGNGILKKLQGKLKKYYQYFDKTRFHFKLNESKMKLKHVANPI